MKWKSVSPDSKRRDSPKFKQNPNVHYYNLYRDDQPGYSSFKGSNSSYPNSYVPYTSSYTPYPLSYQPAYTPSYNSIEMRLRDMERREWELERELEFYRNQRNESIQVQEQFSADEDEDELYFYGGGSKRKEQSVKYADPDTRNETNELIKTHGQSFEPVRIKSEEYDPADFESASSSSWSSDEVEYIDSISKKGKKRPNKTKLPSSSVVIGLIKPKAYAPKLVDLDAPTVMKLPPNPIPSTWANLIHNPLKPQSTDECKEILTGSIKDLQWLEPGQFSVQGILMRPPFDEEEFTVKKWAKFMQRLLPKVMPDGYLFIWVEREELAEVLRASEKYLSFKYVENLCWIRRDLGNRIMKETPRKSGFFYKSKMTLLILRRDPNNLCKLRHQRNPDCILDFVGPGRMPDGRVYDVIETLLDGTKSAHPHLMHLWAGSSPTDRLVYQARKHWIRVLEAETDCNEQSENEFHRDEKSHRAESTGVESTESHSVKSDIVSNPVKLQSGAFDEDFCNFIICEPIEEAK